MAKSLNHTNHLATLDGLRGLAALAVLWFHISELIHLEWTLPHVYMAVDFFFMLSGYVVAKAYEAKLNSTMSFPEFVIVRMQRLYPMIFITVFMGAFVLIVRMVTSHTVTSTQIIVASISGLLLMPTSVLFNLYPDDMYPVNGSFWSLFFELVVNFIYAPITRYLSNRRVLAIAVLSGIAMCFVASHFHSVGVGWGASNFFFGFIRATFTFSIGVLLFRYAPPAHSLGDKMTLFVAFVLLATLFFPAFPMTGMYEMYVLTFVFPPLVWFGAACGNSPRLNSICLWLGAISYPVYLMHHSTMRITVNALQILHIQLPLIIVALVTFGVTIIASHIILKVWDEPVRKWLSARRKKRAALKAASPEMAE